MSKNKLVLLFGAIFGITLFSYFSLVLWAVIEKLLSEDINVIAKSILVALFAACFIVSLLVTLVLIIAMPIVVFSILFTRRIFGIPKPVYKDFLQHLRRGEKLLTQGEKEKFDDNTPIPISITSYKFVKLGCDYNGKLGFRSTTYSTTELFGINATAVCRNKLVRSKHKAPDKKCSCGFYSCSSFDELLAAVENNLANFAWCVLLVCNISGRIEEASNGYRSEHLGVLEVKVSRYCALCNKKRRKDIVYATKLGLLDEIDIEQKSFVPICDSHDEKYDTILTLQGVRERLGVDVSWYEIEPLAETG